jgi:hypothetical protein
MLRDLIGGSVIARMFSPFVRARGAFAPDRLEKACKAMRREALRLSLNRSRANAEEAREMLVAVANLREALEINPLYCDTEDPFLLFVRRKISDLILEIESRLNWAKEAV